MNLKELQERREAALGEAKAITGLESATAEQLARADELIAEVKEIDSKIDRAVQLAEIEERGNKTLSTIAGEADESTSSGEKRTVVEVGENHSESEPWGSLGVFMRSVHSAGTPDGLTDVRLLRAASGLNESVPSDGGFLVQKDFATELLKKTHDTGVLQSRTRRMPISSNSNGTKVNGIDETSRADGARWGGIRAYWADEAELKTKSKPKFRQMSLDLNKLVGLCYATDEALQDAAQLEATINEAFPEEFGFKLDDAFMNGDGSGKPLGIMKGPGLITVDAEVGQTADTFIAENVYEMYSRLWTRSMGSSAWFISQDVWPQIFQLHQVVGTGGVPLFIPGGGINAAPNGTLMGRPIVPIEQCQKLGDKGDIVFADFSQYIHADKGGIESAMSIHVRFIYDESVFRFVYRIDGQPIWNSPLTPFNGGPTVSPYITLAERA